MFTDIRFDGYSERRLDHYKRLAKYKIDPKHISEPIIIDNHFFDRIKDHLQEFLIRRLQPEKFSSVENKAYKNLLREKFPEILQIFEYRGAAVYWFTMNKNNDLSNEEILNHYSIVKKNGGGWWTQANHRRTHPTDILYLGKIEGALQNRFIQHIGLGHNNTTALKLQHWVPSIGKELSLTFQYVMIPNEMKSSLEDIETVLWKECKPLLGAPPKIKD